jgi:hypothetical protein
MEAFLISNVGAVFVFFCSTDVFLCGSFWPCTDVGMCLLGRGSVIVFSYSLCSLYVVVVKPINVQCIHISYCSDRTK